MMLTEGSNVVPPFPGVVLSSSMGRELLLFALQFIELKVMKVCIFVTDFNEISPSKLLRNNIKVKEKFSVVLVHSHHKSAQYSYLIMRIHFCGRKQWNSYPQVHVHEVLKDMSEL